MKLTAIFPVLLSFLIAGTAPAAITPYLQDFEGMAPGAANDLSDDGWLVGANVFAPDGGFVYNYFAFPAPNGGPAFSAVATGEGGPSQGANQLSVYNDYNNADHRNGTDRRIEANVFRDAGTLSAADVGRTFLFGFDAKAGTIGGTTTATAFLKVLRTSDGSFALLGQDVLDMTAVGNDWTGGELSLTIDAAWQGELLQFGFTNTASNDAGSGIFYDNLSLTTAIPEPGHFAVLAVVVSSAMAFRFRNRRRLAQAS